MKRMITNGAFDLLHYGHINLLCHAKARDDYQAVALSPDECNWEQKHKKCYFDYDKRRQFPEAICCVDPVIPETNWDQKTNDVHEYHIDTFVVGDDWKDKFDFLKDEGVEVVYLSRTSEVSMTEMKHDLNAAGEGRPWLNLVAAETPSAALNDVSHSTSDYAARDGGTVIRLCLAGACGCLDLAA